MANVFHSAHLTFGRAQHHIKEFQSAIDGLVKREAWAFATDTEAHPGKHTDKIKFVGEIPETLTCLLFDIANNLRAVLDQAGYASAVAGKSTSLKAVKFPFGPTEDDWRRNLKGGCKDLPTEIRAIFEGFKGYQEGMIPSGLSTRLLTPRNTARSSLCFSVPQESNSKATSRLAEITALSERDGIR
jgi:hypothetical protein